MTSVAPTPPLPPPLAMKAIFSLSPGTMSKWMTAGVLSLVLARVSGSQADLRK